MPLTANAKKALRQQKVRETRNKVTKARVRTMVKKASLSQETSVLSQLYSIVDKAVKKHILPKNKAARIKAQAVRKAAAPVEKKVKSPAKRVKKTKSSSK